TPSAATASAPATLSDIHDVLAADGGEGGADLIAAARAVADDVLAPAAEETDQADIVPRSHLRALADAGLFDASGHREVYEILAGACGATFFVWVQHHAPVRLLQASA